MAYILLTLALVVPRACVPGFPGVEQNPQRQEIPLMIDWSALVSCRLGEDTCPALPSRIQIPRPPQSVVEFLKLVEFPDVSLNQLAETVERDVELASNVLRLVNSSVTMLRHKISSIQHAIGLLGLRRCKMMVMSAALQASFQVKGVNSSSIDTLFSEAQERALYASRVAALLQVDADQAYVAALLQDLILYQLRDQFSEVYAKYDQHSEALVDFERVHFGWDHALAASQMLRTWNFPDELVASVCYHHEHALLLVDRELLNSGITAVAISSLLPGAYSQEPESIHLFVQYQHALPQFDFLEIAQQVDHETAAHSSEDRTAMADRLERMALAAVHQSRTQVNWIEQQLGSYTIEEEIGRGGMGVVYRARHTMLRRPAAVKLMQATKVSKDSLSRFHAEAQITSELSSPHTVQVYDHGVTPEGTLYYVMEYLDGMTLTELVTQFGPLPEGRIIHILCQVCGSLSEAHAKGLIHRDIKPDNIALTTCGGAFDFAKVLDFGLVSVLADRHGDGGSSTVIGTPSYMSPESIQYPDQINYLSDIYSLGAVAFYLATGKVLFEELSLREIIRAQVEQTVPLINDIATRPVSHEFEQNVKSCLEKNPLKRPQSVVSLATQLSRLPAAQDWSFLDAEVWWHTRTQFPRPDSPIITRPMETPGPNSTKCGRSLFPATQGVHQMSTTIINQ